MKACNEVQVSREDGLVDAANLDSTVRNTIAVEMVATLVN